jgi:hypothetical protein
MKYTTLILILLAVLSGLAAVDGLAQQAPTDAATPAETKDLEQKAQFLKQKFEELLANMLDVATLLEETEPETAKILRRTVEHAQRELVAEKMDAVRRALREGLDQAAQQSQGEVVTQLGTMLRILEGAEVEKSETDKKIAERRAALEEVDRLLEAQENEEKRTRAAAHAEEIDRDTQALLDALKALAERQKDLMEDTGKLPADNEQLQRLGQLRDAIDDLLDKQQKLNAHSEKAALGKLPVLGEAQKQLVEAAAQLGEKIKQADADGNISKSIDKAGGNPKALDGAVGNVASAGKEMDRAAASLGKSHKEKARLPQRQAEADLQAARDAIDAAMGKIAGGSKTGQIASSQEKLAGETGMLDEKIKAVAEKAAINPESLGKSGEQQDGQPAGQKSGEQGGQKSGEQGGQKGGEQDGQQGGEQGGQKSGEQGGQKGGEQGGQKGAQQPKGNLKKAAGHMQKAAEEVTAQDTETATTEQGKALAELQKKLEQVAELRERAMAKAKQELDATKQGEIASDTGKLAETMKKGTDGKPMGGQESVAGASKSAGSAAGKMSQGQAGGANADQKKTAEQLRQAQQQLQEEIAELEERSKAEKLARIEQRLEKVLEKQKVITAQTRTTWDDRDAGEAPYDREAEQTLLDNARKEGQLADEVERVLKLLKEEGTTIIFPEILEDVHSDLNDVQKRLASKDPGPLTQSTQQEIERTLEELINAVRDELSKGPGRAQGGGGQGQGGNKKPPLIPPIAELRMLRLKQVRILSETRQLEAQVKENGGAGEDAKAKASVLSREQGRVKKLTTEIKKKMTAPGSG